MFLSISRIPYRTQWQAGLTLAIGAIIVGTMNGWTSPYIAKLTAPHNDHSIKLTYSEASWIASLSFLGGFIGAVLGATIQGFIGRKKTLLSMCGPFAVGWTLIIVAPTVSWLYASRIITGLSIGMIFTASVSFLGEIADPMIRGSLIIIIPNAITLGGLLGTIMGGLLPMEIFSYVCLGLTALFGVLFAFVPESPYYYIVNGDYKNAEKSLLSYNKDANIEQEIRELKEMVGGVSVTVVERIEEVKKPQNLKNLLIIFIMSLFPYCAGLNSMESYAEIILTKSKVDLTPKVVVMFLSFSAMVAGMMALVLVDKFGRRALLMGSGLGVGVGHVILGSHFHMLSLGIEPEPISWLPVFSLFLVFFSMPCGLGTVICTLVGELFPPNLKTAGSFIFTAISAIMSFAVSKSFQPYLDLVGEKFVFWTFATVALCSVVFSYFYIPETTRISLKGIQDNFKNANEDIDIRAKDAETNVRVNN